MYRLDYATGQFLIPSVPLPSAAFEVVATVDAAGTVTALAAGSPVVVRAEEPGSGQFASVALSVVDPDAVDTVEVLTWPACPSPQMSPCRPAGDRSAGSTTSTIPPTERRIPPNPARPGRP